MKRLFAISLALCLLCCMSASVHASGSVQHTYSPDANSGIRGEVCTTLLGTTAGSYYTGSCTYENLSALSSSALLDTLRALLTDTHTYTASFSDCQALATKTDCENGDSATLSLFYTAYTATAADFSGNNPDGWNRSCIWPQRLGGFKTSGPGADLHHIRPTDQMVTYRRDQLLYGPVTGGTPAYAAIANDRTGGNYNATHFDPPDCVKGDVARILLYMYVRYGGDVRYNCGSLTTVIDSIDLLLQWCAQDPVDTWEMGRNEVVSTIQGNRNVFIDYPELAWQLFDRVMPTGMTTPSGMAAATPNTCPHESLSLRGASAATCILEGYTGDTCCTACGKIITAGTATPLSDHVNANADQTCDLCGASVPCGHGETTVKNAKAATCTKEGRTGTTSCSFCGTVLSESTVIPPLGHTEQLVNQSTATCAADGYSGDTVCATCGKTLSKGTAIPATGEHSFGDWTTGDAGIMERSCSACGLAETQPVPTTVPPTEAAPTTQPEPPETTHPAQTETEPQSSGSGSAVSSESWILILTVLLAAAIAGLIASILVNRRAKPEKEKTE